ncbi:MAG: hypothetical protein Q8L64_00450 [bacterium]|nr:hypothetical protein [bacterium]
MVEYAIIFLYYFNLRPSTDGWTDAAALCPFPLAQTPPAASILNSLGGKSRIWRTRLFSIIDEEIQMKKDARDYLNTEYNNFQKAYEIQFTHFMGVFYFWIGVATAPVAAGLLSKHELDSPVLPILLALVAFIGLFLSAKMFDISITAQGYE